ncbi:BMP-2-inducible protein kinase [Sparganum proliferum]
MRHTTLAYRAPEMVDLYTDGGQPIGTPVDIWALGCVVFGLCFFSLPFGTNALAIQTGQFAIPDHSSYSPRLHKLIRFMLSVEAVRRPDIFQVASLAFSLLGRPNPVLNVNASPIPSWQSLTDARTESALLCMAPRKPQLTESGWSSPQLANDSQLPSAATPAITDSAVPTRGYMEETVLLGKPPPPPPVQRAVSSTTQTTELRPTTTQQATAPVTVPPRVSSPTSPHTLAFSSSSGGSHLSSLSHSHLSFYEAPQLSMDLTTRLPPPLPKPLPPPPRSRRTLLHRRGASDGSVLAILPNVRHSQSLCDLIQPTLSSPPLSLQTYPPVPVFPHHDFQTTSLSSHPPCIAAKPPPIVEFSDERGLSACSTKPSMVDADLFGAVFDAIRSEAKGHTLAR